MSAPICRPWAGALLLALALPAAGQSLDDVIAGAKVGPGYAQLLNLSSAPDVSTARYNIDTGAEELSIQVGRLVHEQRWRALSDSTDLYWRGAGGYSWMSTGFPTSSGGAGKISSSWRAFSLTAGLVAKIRLGDEFTLLPALDFGVARLDSRAKYSGTAVGLQPFLDGRLFNWDTNATLVTPNIGLEWSHRHDDRTTTVRLHAAWSRITSFEESHPVLTFRESAGVTSIRAEHVALTSLRVAERPLRWVVFGGHAAFFGPNRAALGFPSVSELGLGFEVPLVPGDATAKRVRVSGSYLVGPNVEGWSVSAAMQY